MRYKLGLKFATSNAKKNNNNIPEKLKGTKNDRFF